MIDVLCVYFPGRSWRGPWSPRGAEVAGRAEWSGKAGNPQKEQTGHLLLPGRASSLSFQPCLTQPAYLSPHSPTQRLNIDMPPGSLTCRSPLPN